MIIPLLVSCVLLSLAALPAFMVYRNLPLFRPAALPSAKPTASVSVLIPARDEEGGIAETSEAVLANVNVDFEMVVMDDHSTDRTARIVEAIAAHDARLRLVAAPPLPSGWNGKQHACWELSRAAKFENLLFLDADVRLSSTALERLLAEQTRTGVALLSGFPRQITVSLAEQLMIPMMHFVLLGYLPLDQMRASTQPQFGAGCGQLFLANKAAYQAAGGHAAIRSSRHDGLQLPRSFRRANLSTDLFDASDIASVRMYYDWPSVFVGLQKNASEGMANRQLIVLFSVLLFGSAIMPALTLGHAFYHGWPLWSTCLLSLATLLSFTPRAMLAYRLNQAWFGVLLHPLAVAIFVALQWLVFIRGLLGRPNVTWRGRA